MTRSPRAPSPSCLTCASSGERGFPPAARDRPGFLIWQVREEEITTAPLVFIDTAGCDCAEDEAPPDAAAKAAGGASSERRARLADRSNAGVSKANTAEARVVCAHVRALLAAGLRHDEIGVITPYNAQVPSRRARGPPDC